MGFRGLGYAKDDMSPERVEKVHMSSRDPQYVDIGPLLLRVTWSS